MGKTKGGICRDDGICTFEAVADLGAAVGGNCLLFMMKTQLDAPFSARRAPLILNQMHSFSRFFLNVGNI